MTKSVIGKHGILGVILVICFASWLAGDQGTLAGLYRTGKIRLVADLTIDASSLPKDVLFVGLTAISSDFQGNIYVLDYADNNIKKFDQAGKFLKVIGRKGQGPGEFNFPYGMTVAGDRLVVYDMRNMRLSLLDLDGRFIKNVPQSDLAGMPMKFRGLPGGKVVLETEKTYFNMPEKPQDRRISILGPDLNPEKEIYFRPVLRNIYIKVPSGGTSNVPQPFCPDVYWDVSLDGKILIGLAERYEVGIFDGAKGKLGTIARAWDPIWVTDEDKKKWFDGMGQVSDKGAKLGAPDFLVKATKFPRFKPAFDEVLWDPEGNILVHPILKEGQSRYYDAFTSKGEFIARVEFVGSPQYFYSQPKKVSGGFIWACETDADGNFRIVKWRFSR